MAGAAEFSSGQPVAFLFLFFVFLLQNSFFFGNFLVFSEELNSSVIVLFYSLVLRDSGDWDEDFFFFFFKLNFSRPEGESEREFRLWGFVKR